MRSLPDESSQVHGSSHAVAEPRTIRALQVHVNCTAPPKVQGHASRADTHAPSDLDAKCHVHGSSRSTHQTVQSHRDLINAARQAKRPGAGRRARGAGRLDWGKEGPAPGGEEGGGGAAAAHQCRESAGSGCPVQCPGRRPCHGRLPVSHPRYASWAQHMALNPPPSSSDASQPRMRAHF